MPAIPTAQPDSFVTPFFGQASSPVRLLRSLLFVVSVLFLSARSHGLSAAEPEPASTPKVLAIVDGRPITDRELERELARVVGRRKPAPDAVQPLREATLQQLIERRLAAAYLQQNGFGATGQEIERQIQRIRARLAQQQLTLDQYLQRSGLTDEQLRETVAWEIAWPRLLERYLTEENLERYFQQHQRDLDGTEVEVAHILLRVEPPGDPQQQALSVAAAEKLRSRILAGELTFAEAAQQHSAAPTAADGGRIGLIGRRQPMPEPFARAAFALEPGKISPPVVTVFGVHLIQCLAVKPGTKSWQDVRAELESAVSQHLFHWIAGRQRPQAKIELTGSPAERKQ